MSVSKPWLVSIAYTDLPSDARVIRETREELRAGARVTLLVPESAGRRVPGALEAAEVVWLPVPQERGQTTVRGHWRFMRAIRTWCRAQPEQPDVVHVHNMPDYLLLCVRHWQRTGTRVVLDVHDIMSHLVAHRFRGIKAAIALRVLRSLEGAMWKRADAIITVHDAYVELIEARGVPRKRITAVLNVPDPEQVHGKLRRPTANGTYKLVFHGAVTERSGIVRAVAAMPEVLREYPMTKLLIIGTGDARDPVQSTIERLGIGHAVTFIDRYVPLSAAIDAIADADIGLVPTEQSEYTRYMLPVKLTEYAALGIPSIATRLPLVVKYFGDDGAHLLTDSSPEHIARAILELLSDPAHRSRVADGARRFAASNNWDKYADALIHAVGISRSGVAIGR